MPKYLIEVSHEDNREACELAKLAFYRTGSHFVTNADWGCSDGEHKAWINVEVDSKEEAKMILPPAFRAHAKVIEVQKLDRETMEQVLNKHKS
jgi:hypothetical protein